MPDRIVGVSRGGLIAGTMLSHYFDVPFTALHWSTRDHTEREANLWLPEEAYNGQQILLVDDILDSGKTIEEICDNWEEAVASFPDASKMYDNIRIVTLHKRKSCTTEIDYYALEVEDEWVVYPWEKWWK